MPGRWEVSDVLRRKVSTVERGPYGIDSGEHIVVVVVVVGGVVVETRQR